MKEKGVGIISRTIKKVTLEFIYQVVNERTEEIKTEMTDIKSELKEIKSDIRSLNQRIDALNQRIDTVINMLVKRHGEA